MAKPFNFVVAMCALCILATGCGVDGDAAALETGMALGNLDDSSAQSHRDVIEGTFFVQASFPSSSVKYITTLELGPESQVRAAEIYLPSGSAESGSIRKRSGTFVRSGSQYVITWSSETCNPVGTQMLGISSSKLADKIFVQSGSSTVEMLSEGSYAASIDLSDTSKLTEDVACNRFP